MNWYKRSKTCPSCKKKIEKHPGTLTISSILRKRATEMEKKEKQ